MTPEQKDEFVETCRVAVNAVLTAITQDDPRFWLEGKYLRWGAVEKALMAGIEQAAGALVTHDPYIPTLAEWAAYPWAAVAATDGSGVLRLYDMSPSPETLSAMWCAWPGTKSLSLRWVSIPANFRNTLRRRPGLPEGI